MTALMRLARGPVYSIAVLDGKVLAAAVAYVAREVLPSLACQLWGAWAALEQATILWIQ